MFPHPSEIDPQFFCAAAHVVGVQAPWPQTLAVPPPPHESLPEQAPQLSVPPHPSGIVPQFAFAAAQVVGVQRHWCWALQLEPPPHPPQSSTAAQPSDAMPQAKPSSAHVVGTHVPGPQTFAVLDPPQLSPDMQVPHSSVRPQPSLMLPQFFPCAWQVVGVHCCGVTHAPNEQTCAPLHTLHCWPNVPHAAAVPAV